MGRSEIQQAPNSIAPWAGTSLDRFQTALRDAVRAAHQDVSGIVYFAHAGAQNVSESTSLYRSITDSFFFGPHLPKHVSSLAKEVLYDLGDASLPTTIVTVYDRDRDRFAHRRFNGNEAVRWKHQPANIKHLAEEAWSL